MNITLPVFRGAQAGTLQPYTLRGPRLVRRPPRRAPKLTRIAYSAAHVVADARAAIDPWLQCAIDWDATIAYRQRLWRLGLGVAEAMDTAQRGMGLDWPTSLELIRRSHRRHRATCPVPSGQRLRHRPPGAGPDARSIDDVIRAYEPADGGHRERWAAG